MTKVEICISERFGLLRLYSEFGFPSVYEESPDGNSVEIQVLDLT